MNELTKAFNDLNENQSKLENDFLLKTEEIKKSKINLLRKILLNGEIKLTKKDFSDYLTFSMNASSYVFSGISNNLLDKNKFNVKILISIKCIIASQNFPRIGGE